MPEKALLNARDVAEIIGCKVSMAYKIIRECNGELRQAGKLVIRGRVNRKYLYKKLDVSEV